MARGGQVEDDALFPETTGDAWSALIDAVAMDARLSTESADPRLMRLDFKSGTSMMTFGQRFSATVRSAPEGSIVRITAVAKHSGTMSQNESRSLTIISDVFAVMSEILSGRDERENSVEAGSRSSRRCSETLERRLAQLHHEGHLNDAEFEEICELIGLVSDQGNPSSAIIENRHGVGASTGGW